MTAAHASPPPERIRRLPDVTDALAYAPGRANARAGGAFVLVAETAANVLRAYAAVAEARAACAEADR